jgi:hypothetical protein
MPYLRAPGINHPKATWISLREGSTSDPYPPPDATNTLVSNSGCHRIFPLYSWLMRLKLFTSRGRLRLCFALSRPHFSAADDCFETVLSLQRVELQRLSEVSRCVGYPRLLRQKDLTSNCIRSIKPLKCGGEPPPTLLFAACGYPSCGSLG